MKALIVGLRGAEMLSILQECSKSDFSAPINIVTEPHKALKIASEQMPGLIIIGTGSYTADALSLGSSLKRICPGAVLFYISDDDECAIGAMRQRADYCLLSPYCNEDAEALFKRAKLLIMREKKRIRIHTFGKFGVFIDGKAMSFGGANAREMLALLVDRNGLEVTTGEALAVCWEESTYSGSSMTMPRKAFARLERALYAAGISELVIRTKCGRMINKEVCDCDYFDFLDGDKKAISDFTDEYMSDYSWGEETLGRLYATKHGNA